MKHLKLGYGIVSTLLITTTNVWAAEGARLDNSGIFVWAFLGVCALIVVAQLIPAIVMVAGAVKGFVEIMKNRQKAVAHSKPEGN